MKMSTLYTRLLKDFSSGADIMNAIISNNPSVYYYISEIMIVNSNIYRNIETGFGKKSAGQLLLESLIILRRQAKYGKITFTISKDTIFIANIKSEFIHYLDQLLMLNSEISLYKQVHNYSGDFEKNLISGQGFHKVLKLKGIVTSSLYSFGCRNDDDKEEIFNECLVVFWQKLTKNEIGFYLSGKADKPDNYHVYNKKFFQNSKLSTYLTGIAKNIFLNRIRSAKYSEPIADEISSGEITGHEVHPSENSLVFMFLFYRAFVEPRKLRSVISILQYDCNLEDKEVRYLIGLNNARIHSCRLRNNFHEWYNKNLDKSHVIYDKATVYLEERQSKTGRLSEKLRIISSFRRSPDLWKVDLGIFREEFRTHEEFRKFHLVFSYLVYLSYTGKPSNLAGLPDENPLRDLMDIYKDGMFALSAYQSLFFLFFYNSDEPENIIIRLLKELYHELSEPDQNAEYVAKLATQLGKNSPADESDLINKIYETNCILFSHFTREKDFLHLIIKNEPGQRTI